MKRILFAVTAIACMIMLMVMPAMAEGIYYEHIIPLTKFSIADNYGYVYLMDGPFHIGRNQQENVQESYMTSYHGDGAGWAITSNSYNNTEINTQVQFYGSYGEPDGFEVYVSTTDTVVNRQALLNCHMVWSAITGVPDEVVSFTLQAKVTRMELQNGLWRPVDYNVYRTVSNTSIDITQELYAGLPAKIKQDDYVYIKSLSVVMTNSYSDTDYLVTNFRSYGASVQYPAIGSWLNQFNMTHNTGGSSSTDAPDMIGWAGGAISGFLNIELWPGFAIHDLMNVLVVLGLLFWFLKLTV